MEFTELSEPNSKKRAIIRVWPKNIDELKGLTSLVVDGIGTVPSSIGDLANLK